MMGDCGAFAYADQPQPAYTPEEVFEFYDEADFTHGCSPDHIIFDFDAANPPRSAMEARVTERFDISIENAQKFLKICQKENALFEPMGAVQGWSPESLGSSAKKMENMGYRYLAIGGLVPLKPASIELCLQAIRQEISPDTKIHLLGFAKAHLVTKFAQYDVASFDSTSPLLRAFKDKTANYFSAALDGGIDYFTAIRIPQALENPKLMRAVKTGAVAAEKLIKLEKAALEAARQYDKDEKDPEQVAQIINDYQREFLTADCKGNLSLVEKEVARSLESTLVTLKEAPWKRCSCLVCKTIGIEVVLFRASNRNKRRGIHNLYVFYEHLQRTVVEPAAATSMKSKVTATRKHKRKSEERVR